MMKRYSQLIPALFLLAVILNSCQKSISDEVILTLFAHPDDETAMGAVLAKYAENNSVYLVFATDGQYGVTKHAGIPPGDSLVEIRKKEAECSCASLGIYPPIFLGLQDGLGLNGHGNFYEQESILKERLLSTIKEIQPTKIITYGPDGDTGHPDHRMVGLLCTEVLLREGMIDELDLYFFAWSKDQAEKYSWWDINYMDKSMLDVAIHFDQIHEDAAIKSIRCHQSQYTREEMERWIKAEIEDTSNLAYFRKFKRSKRIRTEL